jgi:predicted TIM-barrel fold metal-dependent hydrolase
MWHRRNVDLRYALLDPGYVSTAAGNTDLIRSPTYDSEGYRAESRFAGVAKAVHIQAAIGTDDPVRETAWLNEESTRMGIPLAIVAGASLQSPDLETTLERHLAFANVRGIRDALDGNALDEPALDPAMQLLAKFDLSLEVGCHWQQMGDFANVAGRNPRTKFVLVHMGLPIARDREYFERWCQGIRYLTPFENVFCKISGVGLWDPLWTVESIRPWVVECIEAFGATRCFFGSNWPVDRQYSSFDSLIASYRMCVADFSREEQRDLLLHNAERVYRL